jgi:phosphoribosylformylglycinamidine synthase
MAAAFDRAGFDAVDVHMTDLVAGPLDPRHSGLVACGGFSYGDVLGAGEGWAKSILFHNARARDAFEPLLRAPDTFALGVCNGCQMMSAPARPHPRAPRTGRASCATARSSSRRACRWSRSSDRPSIFFEGMEGLAAAASPSPTAKARAELRGDPRPPAPRLESTGLVAARFVDGAGDVPSRPATPHNPNGSPAGITGADDPTDGRVTIMMPHPERVFRTGAALVAGDHRRGADPQVAPAQARPRPGLAGQPHGRGRGR